MPPLEMETETLGQKHRRLNELVQAAVADKTPLPPLDYDSPDVDNLLKIDVACKRRNVDYVLEVLRSEDTLYVSRAIKKSTWLITDDQYAHIINPEYLHNKLFPGMTAKAKNKLIAAIRLNLKSEHRVEEFFKYYSHDIKVAQKWLPHCSPAFVEKVFAENIQDITVDTFKRICENSIKCFKLLIKDDRWYIWDKLDVSRILIAKFPEEYLDIMLSLRDYKIPRLGIHATRQIMQKCPDKVIKNFQKLHNSLHRATFAKFLKKDDVKDFLLKQAADKKMKDWVKYDNIKYFIKYLPVTNRFEFIKKLFVDKEEIAVEPEQSVFQCEAVAMRMCKSAYYNDCSTTSNAHIYRWYQFAPFDTAFTDLKKLIRVESAPAERNAILTVLISCARRNPQHVHSLLQFYREKHMNEPFKFKVQFVNKLLSLVGAHKFDPKTWNILTDIFASMEVFMESENNVPYCVKAIVVYNLLHNEAIPSVIEKKYVFDTYEDYRKKLDSKDGDKVFTYVYENEMKKLNEQKTDNEYEINIAQQLLMNVLTLLKTWEKQISDFPAVLEKIRQIIKTKKENSFTTNISEIYRIEKKWRRSMFEESLALASNDQACLNALRHDPGLLSRCETDVSAMCSSDGISLKHTLSKIRIYWPQSLAEKWTEMYLEALDKPVGHKATSEGVCILLPRKRFLGLLEKYAPSETKIDWSNTDQIQLSLHKNIAKRMKFIRPTMNLDEILSYAKDDYLQFALPSFNSVTSNMSAEQVQKHIPLLFEGRTSLKKHGLRLAYTKLEFSDIKTLVTNIWNDTKNSSIKTVLIKETFDLLKKEKKDSSILELWALLEMFIQNLTQDENRIVYTILGNAEAVPVKIRPQFFMKSYIYLKSLPAKANCDKIITSLDNLAPKITNLLDNDFIENTLLMSVDEFVATMSLKSEEKNEMFAKLEILASYLINSENVEVQRARYEKYIVPILDACFATWKKKKPHRSSVKDNCTALLHNLINNVKRRVLNNAEVMVNIFKDIDTKLRSALPIEENYRLLTHWSLSVLFEELLINYLKTTSKSSDDIAAVAKQKSQLSDSDLSRKEDEIWQELCTAIAPGYGISCLDFMKQDICANLPSLGTYFSQSLSEVFQQQDFRNMSRILILQNMRDVDVPVSYLVVLQGSETLHYDRDPKIHKLRKELYESIGKHPSTAIKIHYHETSFLDLGDELPYDE